MDVILNAVKDLLSSTSLLERYKEHQRFLLVISTKAAGVVEDDLSKSMIWVTNHSQSVNLLIRTRSGT